MVKKDRSLALLFATSLFASALLLFWVQPLVAKMLLPYLGGSPAVWNTCMVFFQAVLLLGYAYAHVVPRLMGVRRHALLHVGLLLLAAIFLPFSISERWVAYLTGGANPSLWLLGTLLIMVGLPFFILSTNGPLLQRWFASTSHPDARDPYFLYGASNLGSLLALLSYPVLLEPELRLRSQSWLWAAGYIMMILLISLCAFVTGRSKEQAERIDEKEPFEKEDEASVEKDDGAGGSSSEPLTTDETLTTELSWQRRFSWVLLAFVPSSLMLGVTTYLSTDLAPIPLLWVVPLALYLLTFVLVFTKRRIIPARFVARFMMPASALALCYLLAIGINRPIWLLVLFHLISTFKRLSPLVRARLHLRASTRQSHARLQCPVHSRNRRQT